MISTLSSESVDSECMIVFGVLPSSDTTGDSEILYNFAVYRNNFM